MAIPQDKADFQALLDTTQVIDWDFVQAYMKGLDNVYHTQSNLAGVPGSGMLFWVGQTDPSSPFLPSFETYHRPGYTNRIKIAKGSPYYLGAYFTQMAEGRTLRQEENQCDGCQRGNGRFTQCVQLKDLHGRWLWNGSCANCIYGGRPKQCSFNGEYEAAPKTPRKPKQSSEESQFRPSSSSKASFNQPSPSKPPKDPASSKQRLNLQIQVPSTIQGLDEQSRDQLLASQLGRVANNFERRSRGQTTSIDLSSLLGSMPELSDPESDDAEEAGYTGKGKERKRKRPRK